MGCHVLITVTILDQSLIPTMEELFDELYYVTQFLKLDLRSRYH